MITAIYVDDSFKIFTNNYIKYIIENDYNKNNVTTIVINFKNVSRHNFEKGVGVVNQLFSKMFTAFKHKQWVSFGRWTNDNIMMVTDGNPLILIDDFRKYSDEYGLEFEIVLISSTNKKYKEEW
jgi:hypothetical protein